MGRKMICLSCHLFVTAQLNIIMMLPSPPNKLRMNISFTFKTSTAHVGFFIHCPAPPSMLCTITLNANRSINEEFITT